jgi:hypothetical protein
MIPISPSTDKLAMNDYHSNTRCYAVGCMNNNHRQTEDGEAKAKPEVFKFRVGSARAVGYRVPQLDCLSPLQIFLNAPKVGRIKADSYDRHSGRDDP